MTGGHLDSLVTSGKEPSHEGRWGIIIPGREESICKDPKI